MKKRPVTRDDDDVNNKNNTNNNSHNCCYCHHHHHHHLEMRQGSRSGANMPIPCYIEDFVNKIEMV